MTWILSFQGAAGASAGAMDQQSRLLLLRIFAGFWVLGLLNNSAYVIMIAGANEIAASAVGLVYLFAIGPTIIVKLTAPYWFHLVSYSTRFWVAAVLMSCSFVIVGLSKSTMKQLLGVGLVAIQGGLGEASALGLCSLYPNQLSLTAWSSGTGFAGIGGYAWVAVLHHWMQLSYTATLLLANILPVVWLAVFQIVLQRIKPHQLKRVTVDYEQLPVAASTDPTGTASAAEPALRLRPSKLVNASSNSPSPSLELSPTSSSAQHIVQQGHLQDNQQEIQQQQETQHQRLLPGDAVDSSSSSFYGFAGEQLSDGAAAAEAASHRAGTNLHCTTDDVHSMSFAQRVKAVWRLWPYMVPLFVVYFAEYAMQSGTWTAVGFPVTSAEARHVFYLYANWTYQAGVFVSRSSGMLFQANRLVLWLMPAMQCLLLVFFSVDAVTHTWYGWSLLVLCFLAGLLGGAVYVNSFTLLTKEVEPSMREFSLSAACVADSLGIACADVVAILIQGCLFRWQNITGAAYACGP